MRFGRFAVMGSYLVDCPFTPVLENKTEAHDYFLRATIYSGGLEGRGSRAKSFFPDGAGVCERNDCGVSKHDSSDALGNLKFHPSSNHGHAVARTG